jgi:UDP:flavonoid glycosyltransferase YjiC (YdhE family)
MRVGIQGWGSEGDLRPLVALAGRLRASGHEVRLLFTPVDAKDYQALCRSFGVELKLVPDQMEITLQRLVSDAKKKDPTKLMSAVLDLTYHPHVEAMYAAALDLAASSDVLVSGPTCWTLKAASAKTGVPYAAVDYVPALVPSHEVPPVIFPSWKWLAGPTWWLLHRMMDMAFCEAPRKFFAEKGLPPIRHAIPDVVFSEHLNLHAASPAFWPPAPDWSDIHCVCGEFLVPGDAESWSPSPSLHEFLDAGPPPALLSLGSWEHMAPERTRALLIESAREAKMRAIVQTKTDAGEGRDGDLYFLPWAPHAHLVPSCSVVLHHGGAGTTHMALRAGRPALVLPFILEQRMWARKVQRAGAGLWRSFWKATPRNVGALLRKVASSEALRAGATKLARAMAAEDGTGAATRRLERLASRSSGVS